MKKFFSLEPKPVREPVCEPVPGVRNGLEGCTATSTAEAESHPQPQLPEPQPEPEPEPELEPTSADPCGPHYTGCYELTYVMLDKQMSPSQTALRQLVWLPERHSPRSSTVLVMIIYPTGQPIAPTSLLNDMFTVAALGSPFANPIDVSIHSRRTGSASSAACSSPGMEQTPVLTDTIESKADELVAQRQGRSPSAGQTGIVTEKEPMQHCAELVVLEVDCNSEDATIGSEDNDEDEKAFRTPNTIRDVDSDAKGTVSPDAAELSPPRFSPDEGVVDRSSLPTSPASVGVESESSLSSLPRSPSSWDVDASSLPSKFFQQGTEWGMRKIENFAERKGISRQIPFSGVIVFEVDWDLLTGFEYWNQLVQEGRICMETNRVHKRRFKTVEHAARHYKLRPTSECARRCGLGVERDPRSEIFNQPELLPDEQRMERQRKRMGHEGSSWRYIPWPEWDDDGNSTPRGSWIESNAPIDQKSVCRSTGSASSDTSSLSRNNSAGDKDKEAPEPKAELVSAQMLAIYFTCPFLPGAAGRLMLLPERSKVLRDYEAGLPGWAVNLATNRFVPNLPLIGVWYRPRMRTLLTAVMILVQVISMICGFYDLWRNIPFIQPTLILICTPVYNWVIGPLSSVLSSFFSSIFSAFITSGLSSLFSGMYHAFSFVLAPMISAMFMAFQPLVALFSPLVTLLNTLLRTFRTFTGFLLDGPRLAMTSLGHLIVSVGGLLRPLFDGVAIFVKAFGGMISGLVAFPFQLLVTLLKPLVLLGTVLVRSVSIVVNPLRRLMGFGASSAQVVNTVSTFQKLQELWTTVLRPIKAVVKSVYDSVIMVTTKLLKHRLTLERLIESKRSESRITRVILSREAMITVRSCCLCCLYCLNDGAGCNPAAALPADPLGISALTNRVAACACSCRWVD
eukprot:COSAG02_NODE_2521_length_8609_cov_3.772503_2_plen_909_part_00